MKEWASVVGEPELRLQRGIAVVAALAGVLTCVPAWSADNAPPIRPGWTLWPEPTARVNLPQTDAEKQAAMVSGRSMPQPELLQPSLDSALPNYVPTEGLTIDRSFRVGSSDVLPGLVTAWIEAFRKFQPGFNAMIERPLAGSLGAKELIKGNLDFVFVSRELKPTDISGFQDKFGYPPFSVPVSGGSWRHFGFLDAVAFMVHPTNPIHQLTFRQIDRAYSTTHWRGGGQAMTWGDLGATGEWAARPVHLYGIKPWNGFEEFVRQRVLSIPGHRGEWNDAAITYDETFFNVARRVANDPLALGYTGLSAMDSEVKVVPLSAEGGAAYTPSYENVARDDYPLSRVLYLNANARSGAALDPALHEFLRFILSREGQAVVRKQGIYLPLRSGQIAATTAYVEGG